MILYLDAKTDFTDVVIDFIEIKLCSGNIVSLTWDESEFCVTDGIFTARYKGIYFDEDYANGRISELNNMCIEHMEIYTESQKGSYFELENLLFEDGTEEFGLENFCYRIKYEENVD